uniref:Protein tweety homolog n=1 Tax=Ditylenchus dipsaci TaxID=166011 RepID=A0A915EEW1_9BILA
MTTIADGKNMCDFILLGCWTPSFVENIIGWLNALPHINYKFRQVKETFNLDIDGDYVQSLVVFCGLSLLLAVLLLLLIVITWVCQCCLKKSDNCHLFRFTGACLYGNEHTNKSVNSAASGLADVNQNIRLAIAQTNKLNASQFEASKHVEELTVLIERKSKEAPTINQTLVREADALLTEVSDKLDDVSNQILKIGQIFGDLKFLDKSRIYGHRVEFERWILCITLISIMICVLFAGVIAFCRQSRKGAILFSGLGIVIFIVSWIMFSLVFPITVAYADFCGGGATPFLETKINQEVIQTFHFYKDCVPKPSHDNVPPKIPVSQINNFYSTLEANQQKLEGLLFTLFNRSEEVELISREISSDISNSFKSIGALEATLSCYNIHDDVIAMYEGFCTNGFLGTVIVTSALFMLGLFLFILLLLVSRSWHIFVRLPSDYVEVGEDDHFSPRGQDNMPDNVYDTNIFNPRARQIGGMVDGVPPAAALSNGSAVNNHQPPTTSLLVESSTATWLRNNATHASAPPATNTINSHSAGLRNSNYQLNNPYRHYTQQQQEFQEQFDI